MLKLSLTLGHHHFSDFAWAVLRRWPHFFPLNIVHREPFDVDVIISDLVSLCFQNICFSYVI